MALSFLNALPVVWVVPMILVIIVHIAFALGVWEDSRTLYKLRRRTFFVSGGMWALGTLLGGVITSGIYWILHHSTLRPSGPSTDIH